MALKAKDINEQTKWQDLTEGLQIFEPATSRMFETGEWRTATPIVDYDKCIHCLLCVPYCPDSCITVKDNKKETIDYAHCKGCGICAAACPFDAITMKEGK